MWPPLLTRPYRCHSFFFLVLFKYWQFFQFVFFEKQMSKQHQMCEIYYRKCLWGNREGEEDGRKAFRPLWKGEGRKNCRVDTSQTAVHSEKVQLGLWRDFKPRLPVEGVLYLPGMGLSSIPAVSGHWLRAALGRLWPQHIVVSSLSIIGDLRGIFSWLPYVLKQREKNAYLIFIKYILNRRNLASWHIILLIKLIFKLKILFACYYN